MNVSKEFILSKLPPFVDKRVTIADDQQVRDIIATMLTAHKRNAPLYDRIGLYFMGKDIAETCDKLFSFCKRNLVYKIEPGKLQKVQVPQGLLSEGHCDCKGYASFICGCLDAIKRSGKQLIDWEYCFASYEMAEKTPYHVFSVVKKSGADDIWVDPTPGANDTQPFWLSYETVKTAGMLQDVIAGIGDKNFYKPNGGTMALPGSKEDQQQVAADALLGAVPELYQVMDKAKVQQSQPPVTNSLRIGRIGEVAADTATSSIVPGLPNAQLALGVGGLLALYLLTRPKVNVLGKTTKKEMKKYLPVVGIAALGIAGYFLYKKFANPFASDPELPAGYKSPDGTLTVAPGVRGGWFARVANFVNPQGGGSYAGIYHDVLVQGLPLYKSAIDAMSYEEQQALYSLINDSPGSSVDSSSPIYPLLVSIRDKYKLPIY